MVETRTGRGVTRRPGRLGHDPFAIAEGETLTAHHRARMEAFYGGVDARLAADRPDMFAALLRRSREAMPHAPKKRRSAR